MRVPKASMCGARGPKDVFALRIDVQILEHTEDTDSQKSRDFTMHVATERREQLVQQLVQCALPLPKEDSSSIEDASATCLLSTRL